MNIGTRVQHSGSALRSQRDYWQGCGREPQKSQLKEAYLKRVAERGTVTALLPADPTRGVSAGLEITWDHGPISRCLSYMVSLAD